MKAQDIHLTDWLRILVGQVPAAFYIELIIRAFAIYLILMISMRAMGKRMSSQLSRNELAALVSLAAAVGIPMMAPDRGILPGIVVAMVLVSIERWIAIQACKSEKFENFAQGRVSALVTDGVVSMRELKSASLSQDRVLAQLRAMGVLQLGAVSRFYMEAGGNFTLVNNPNPQPGLSVLPPWDHQMQDFFKSRPDKQICVQCGFPQKDSGHLYPKCPNCGKEQWVAAVELV